MIRRVIVIGVAALGGCLSTPPPELTPDAQACVDGDGDGWLAGEAGACPGLAYRDCNDADPAVHPGAADLGDGEADRDCDTVPWERANALAPIATTEAGNQLAIDLAGVAFRIDGSQGHAIASMQIGNSGELLYNGTIQERLIGVEKWDHYFSWAPNGDSLAVEADNPAVLRLVVSWADGRAQAGITGTTTWTFHAGGRLYRRERFTLAGAVSSNSMSAYVALRSTAVNTIRWENGGAAEPVPFTSSTATFRAHMPPTDQRWLCAYDAGQGHEIGMATRATASVAVHGARITYGDTQLALQYDWRFGAQPAAGDYSASILMVPAVIVGAPCDVTVAKVAAWRAPPTLLIEGGARVDQPDDDDDVNGFADGSGYWDLDMDDGTMTIELDSSAVIQPGLTFRIEGLGEHDPVIAFGRGGPLLPLVRGRDYLLEVEDGVAWLVISYPLVEGDRIVVLTGDSPAP